MKFNCPYCGESNYTEIFLTEGKSQNFVWDCEVCCRPIEIIVDVDRDGNMNLEIKNDEGF